MEKSESAAARGAGPLALEQQACLALSMAARSVVALYRPLLAPLNLTHPQFLVMAALWEHGPLSVRRLGHLLRLNSGTLSPLLKRLAAIGYLSRERDPADERRVIVALTAAGAALRERAEPVPAAVRARLGLGPGDLAQLHALLADVIAAARDGGDDADPAGPDDHR